MSNTQNLLDSGRMLIAIRVIFSLTMADVMVNPAQPAKPAPRIALRPNKVVIRIASAPRTSNCRSSLRSCYKATDKLTEIYHLFSIQN